jgi:hypothetical protein
VSQDYGDGKAKRHKYEIPHNFFILACIFIHFDSPLQTVCSGGFSGGLTKIVTTNSFHSFTGAPRRVLSSLLIKN